MGGILFDNRYDSRMRHLRPHFQLEGGRPRREAWLKILDITSHGNIPVELTLNPIAGIFSALVDEHLDGNVFIYMLEKIANYFDRFSMLPLQPPPSSSCAVCVFLEIFHLSRRYFRALESVARLGRKKEKVRKYARSLFVTILEL